jgi:hypothetical protein
VDALEPIGVTLGDRHALAAPLHWDVLNCGTATLLVGGVGGAALELRRGPDLADAGRALGHFAKPADGSEVGVGPV